MKSDLLPRGLLSRGIQILRGTLSDYETRAKSRSIIVFASRAHTPALYVGCVELCVNECADGARII